MHDHCSLTNVEEIDETQFIINIDMTSTLSAREELSVWYVDAVFIQYYDYSDLASHCRLLRKNWCVHDDCFKYRLQ